MANDDASATGEVEFQRKQQAERENRKEGRKAGRREGRKEWEFFPGKAVIEGVAPNLFCDLVFWKWNTPLYIFIARTRLGDVANQSAVRGARILQVAMGPPHPLQL